MAEIKNANLEHTLKEITSQLSELDELEHYYQSTKEKLTKQLNALIHQAAVHSDTIALRQQLIRILYWEKDLSAELIGKAFHLTGRKVISLAGTYEFEFICSQECGNVVRKKVNSKTNLKEYKRKNILCNNCKKKIKERIEKEELEETRQYEERQNYLLGLTWQDFIKTEEWFSTRNHLLNSRLYLCEKCDNWAEVLRIHPLKETLTNIHSNNQKFLRAYMVLCDDCFSDSKENVDENRYVLVHSDLFDEIRRACPGMYEYHLSGY